LPSPNKTKKRFNDKKEEVSEEEESDGDIARFSQTMKKECSRLRDTITQQDKELKEQISSLKQEAFESKYDSL